MFHERERFTYRGHVVCIGIEAVRQSSLTNGKETPVFLKTPVIYIDNLKILVDADTARSVPEPLDVVARKIIEEMSPPVAPTPLFRLRRDYWRERGKRIGLNIMGGSLLVTACYLAMLAILPIVVFLFFLAQFLIEPHGSFFDLGLLTGGITYLLLGGFAGVCGWLGLKSREQARQIDPGVPLTRANMDDVSASDSLVRASEEPTMQQEAVLLRAATESQQKHEEQLVRAAGGQE